MAVECREQSNIVQNLMFKVEEASYDLQIIKETLHQYIKVATMALSKQNGLTLNQPLRRKRTSDVLIHLPFRKKT